MSQSWLSSVRGGFAVVLAMLVSIWGCSTGPRALPPADMGAAYEDGTTRDDYLAGARSAEIAVSDCMADRGFEYTPVPAEAVVVFTEDRPGYGVTQGLIDALRGDADAGAALNNERQSARAEGEDYTEALIGCRNQVQNDIGQRQEAAVESRDVIAEAWEQFRSSEPYLEAVEDWASCMESNGYLFDSLSEPERHVIDIVRDLIEAAGDPLAVDETAVAEAQRTELAIWEADQACRSSKIAGLEQTFKEELFTRHAADLELIRRATRGETE